MKNNLLKSGKSALSLVIAFAVLAVSLLTAFVGVNLTANAAATTVAWTGEIASGFSDTSAGTAEDPIIISTPEELAYLVGGAGGTTAGKYYKAADNLVFNMQGMEGITLDSTVADVYGKTSFNKDWASWDGTAKWSTSTFQGNFDGNGLIVYNIYAKDHAAGLFPVIVGSSEGSNTTIKNVTVKNSWFESTAGAYTKGVGAIVGAHQNGVRNGTVIENCSVINCNIVAGKLNNDTTMSAGTIVGNNAWDAFTINNCLVADSVVIVPDDVTVKGGFYGNGNGAVTVSNSVSIGISPVTTGRTNVTYGNVYTDQEVSQSGVTTVATDNMKGAAAKANMPNLEWSVFIAFDGEYPELRSNHTLATVSNGASGHATTCSDCNKSLTETHNMVEDLANMVNKCACGYSIAITEIEDTWDGTKVEPTETDANGTYIISNAEQLAWVALTAGSATNGKNYKVVDNAVFNMNGMTGITMDSTAAEVKAAAKNDSCKWVNESNAFGGNFDGNGLIVYNLYANGGYAGLFTHTKASNNGEVLTFKNVKVAASYIVGYHYAGGIVGYGNAPGTSTGLAFENCEVANCYISDNGNTNTACSRTAAGIAGSVAHNKTTIDNCLIQGNTIAGTNITGGFIGNTSQWASAAAISNSIVIGTAPTAVTTNETVIQPGIANATYTNVYTDQTSSTAGVTALTTAQMTGINAIDHMLLNFDTVWFANTATPVLQIFHNLKGEPDTTNPASGHIASCEDCDVVGVKVTAHTYTDSECTACGYTCEHSDESKITISAEVKGDCVTASYVTKTCECGASWTEDTDEAAGHSLTKTDAKAPTCAEDGNIDYWTCSTCEKIFLSDDDMAAMDTAVDAEEVVVAATGEHVELETSDGKLVYLMDETDHWTYCQECYTEITKTAHEAQWTAVGADGHTGSCSVCGYETADGVVVHNFGDDNACDQCGWTCESHVAVDGDVKVNGDCITDKVTAQYCEICDIALDDKVEDAEGHKLTKTNATEATCSADGNVDYWTCSTCEKIFLSDDKMAAMDTAVDASKTVIAKLPHAYTNVDANNKPVYEYDDTAHWFDCEICGKADYTEHIIETDDSTYDGVYKWCEDAEGYGCGYEAFDFAVSNEDETISIIASTNAFTKDVIFDIFEITTEDEEYADLSKAAAEYGLTEYVLYEISPNEDIAEGGKVAFTVIAPESLGEKVDMYYIDAATGKIERLNGDVVIDEKTGLATISAETDKLGMFAIAKVAIIQDDDSTGGTTGSDSGSTGDVGGDSSNTSPATGETVMVTAVALMTLIAAAFIIVRKVKKA